MHEDYEIFGSPTLSEQENAATQALFRDLGLPEDTIRRRFAATPEDAQRYVDFDNVGSFDQNDTYNREAPSPHVPDKFTSEMIIEAIEGGDVIEGIFSADGELLSTLTTSILCSMTMTVFPLSVSLFSTSRRIRISSK